MSHKRGAMARAYKSKPTKMQLEALAGIQAGKKAYRAMTDAGYKKRVARSPGKNLLSRRGVINYLEDTNKAYIALGISPSYMVGKTKEWLEATRKQSIRIGTDEKRRPVFEVVAEPDYQTQIKGAEFVRRDWGMGSDSNPTTAVQINNYADHSQTQKDKYKIWLKKSLKTNLTIF